MTDAEKILLVKAMTGESADTVVSAYLAMARHTAVYIMDPMIRTFLLDFRTLSDITPARGHAMAIPTPTMVTISPASVAENP